MSVIDLKPCPFCGGAAELRTDKPKLDGMVKHYISVNVWIQCKKCDFKRDVRTAYVELDIKKIELKGTLYEDQTFKHVVNQWNRRADNEQRKSD